MPITLNGTTGITTPMYNGSIAANAVTPSVNMKNRIINGAMVIDQRNAGASVTPTTIGATYTLDRWTAIISAASKFSVQQSSTVPSGQGFVNSTIVTSLSAYSVAAADYFYLTQYVEGFNASDLMWGTANAKTVTLSFWVRSSLTGTFVAAIRSGGDDAAYPATYTINSANTWEQKTITIAGPTTGTFNTTNGKAFGIWFSLGAGSNFNGTANTWAGGGALSVSGAVSVVGTNGATFYITGVQLEVGSTATSFDYRPYGTELALCQRYFYQATGASGNGYEGFATGVADASTSADVIAQMPVTMRAIPTTSFAGTIYVYDGAVTPTLSSVATVFGGKTGIYLNLTTASGLTIGRGVMCYTNNATTNNFAFSAEL